MAFPFSCKLEQAANIRYIFCFQKDATAIPNAAAKSTTNWKAFTVIR